jgi:hypothetical protein
MLSPSLSMIDASTEKGHAVGGVDGFNIQRRAKDCATEWLTCTTEVINGVSACRPPAAHVR